MFILYGGSMIIGADRKKLEEEKQNIYYKLLNATNSKDITIDEINALKSELKHVDLQLDKLIGTNEKERLEKLNDYKSQKSNKDIKRYRDFKNKYKAISKITISTKHILNVIDKLNKEYYVDSVVKVKS